MNEITKIKNEAKLKQWVEMIQQWNESGLTITDWCRQNGINLKTYYYRLKDLWKIKRKKRMRRTTVSF